MLFDQLKRRDFITLLGGTAVAWPLATRAQESGRTYRIGFLLPTLRESPAVVALFDELRLNGFVEGPAETWCPPHEPGFARARGGGSTLLGAKVLEVPP